MIAYLPVIAAVTGVSIVPHCFSQNVELKRRQLLFPQFLLLQAPVRTVSMLREWPLTPFGETMQELKGVLNENQELRQMNSALLDGTALTVRPPREA